MLLIYNEGHFKEETINPFMISINSTDYILFFIYEDS